MWEGERIISFRLSFLRGRGISGKYRFEPQPVLDRHRWVLSYDEAIEFVLQNTGEYQVKYEKIIPGRGRTKLIAEPIEKWLGEVSPNLFVYGVLFDISVDSKR